MVYVSLSILLFFLIFSFFFFTSWRTSRDALMIGPHIPWAHTMQWDCCCYPCTFPPNYASKTPMRGGRKLIVEVTDKEKKALGVFKRLDNLKWSSYQEVFSSTPMHILFSTSDILEHLISTRIRYVDCAKIHCKDLILCDWRGYGHKPP